LPIGKIDEQEKTLLEAAVKELGPSIEKVRRLASHRPSKADEIGCCLPARSPQALGLRLIAENAERMKKESDV